MAKGIEGIAPDVPWREAAGISLQARAAALAAALPRALDPADEEGIHDLRVASRRLRAALSAYKRALPRAAAAAVTDDVRTLFRATGDARDLEVQIARIAKWRADAPEDVVGDIDRIIEELTFRYDSEIAGVRVAVAAFEASVALPRLQWLVWGTTGVGPA